ncbi:TetR family transcriptional regulator [Nocardia tenerifensis]|uniref:TetR family transcriptional regulator n=1 Tax=Nocardia tenerifensis TaxID=228006 RepID=A0A318KEB4_9NOCA|nr:TetR/AcrR family transcriptional regulator [Nocardia tenerifensis]PXX71139.1 TetR family transcriptional regulator [Nocardia tenerifensis]
MPTETERTRKVGRPPRLSQESIIAAADRVLRAEGAESLSMRRLAKELGSTPMALYHHVRDKDELLLLLLESYARYMPRREYPDDPRERLLEAACSLYEGLAERLWIIEVLASDPLVVPSAMGMVEDIVAAAVAYGCTTDEAVDVYRAVWYFIVGDLIIRANRNRRSRLGVSHASDDGVGQLDPARLPTLVAVGDRWAELTHRDIHRKALDAMLEGLLPKR